MPELKVVQFCHWSSTNHIDKQAFINELTTHPSYEMLKRYCNTFLDCNCFF